MVRSGRDDGAGVPAARPSRRTDRARGGIWWAGADGASVEVELHELPVRVSGELVPLLPSPLAVGRVELADGTSVAGLVCAQRPPDAVDVTEHMSWPNYVSASL